MDAGGAASVKEGFLNLLASQPGRTTFLIATRYQSKTACLCPECLEGAMVSFAQKNAKEPLISWYTPFPESLMCLYYNIMITIDFWMFK